jgi:hypothetical protein
LTPPGFSDGDEQMRDLVAQADLLATLKDAQEWADKETEQWISIDDLGWAKTLPRLTENDRKVHPLSQGPITATLY